MSRSSFSKAYEEITFTIEDADLDKLNDVLKDINVRECPWFEVQDKHGNKARYYREPRKKGKWILVTDNRGQHFECDKCGEWRYHQGQNFCSHCGADMRGEQNDTD